MHSANLFAVLENNVSNREQLTILVDEDFSIHEGRSNRYCYVDETNSDSLCN